MADCFLLKKNGNDTKDTSLKLYFDYRKGINGNTWTDTVGNSSINITTPPSEGNDFVVTGDRKLPNLTNMYGYTAYLIYRFTGSSSDRWQPVLVANEGATPHFNCEVDRGYFGIGVTSGAGAYTTTVKATDGKFHIIVMSFLDGGGLLYIDGIKQRSKIVNDYHTPIDSHFFVGRNADYKAIKIYTGLAHSEDTILKNTQSLADEFNIDI